MNGIGLLLLLILAAALPVIIAFFWFRAVKSPVTPPWFLASLAAGILSLLVSVLLQKLFPPPGGKELGELFFGVFIRIALVEEASRGAGLFLLFNMGKRRLNTGQHFGAALGLASGLGFAAVENALYGISDIGITLLRAVTAAPLHGACGIRAGAALFTAGKQPARAVFLFVSAVFIHGAYNLMIVNPAFPPVLAIPVTLAAFFASTYLMKNEARDDENTFT